MLIKRPLLITDNGICAGFKEDVWKDLLKNIKAHNPKVVSSSLTPATRFIKGFKVP